MDFSGTNTPLISVLLPTRGRPELANAFLESLASTAQDVERIEVVVYVDQDDLASGAISHPRLRTTKIVGPPVSIGAANTACLSRASGAIMVLANDDVVVRTPRWDAELAACEGRFKDRIFLAWPNDYFASRRMSTFPVLSRRCCEVLAEPYPAVYRSAFVDYDLYDIFTRLRQLGHDRLAYLEHIVFEHRHHRSGKRAADDTTRRHRRFEDDAMFLARAQTRQRQGDRLAATIEGRPLPPLLPAPNVLESPADPTVTAFARAFLADGGLPPSRRLYLFFWYCGRYVGRRFTQGAPLGCA